MLISPAAFGNTPNASKDLKEINQWTANLNQAYGTLNLSANTSNPRKYGLVLTELEQLDKHLDGQIHLNDGSLVQLACNICVCIGCAGPQQ